MEVLALIALNITFGLGFYIFITSKMNRLLRESKGNKMEQRLVRSYAEFMRESQHSLDLLHSRIQGLRELIHRSEKIQAILREESNAGAGLGLQLQNLINLSKDILDNHSSSSYSSQTSSPAFDSLSTGGERGSRDSKEPIESKGSMGSEQLTTQSPEGERPLAYPTPVPNRNRTNPYQENKMELEAIAKKEKEDSLKNIKDSAPNLVAGIGQKFRSFVGIEPTNIPTIADWEEKRGDLSNRDRSGRGGSEQEAKSELPKAQPTTKSTTQVPGQTSKLSIQVSGDPFETEEEIRDLEREKKEEEGSFLSTLRDIDKKPTPSDQVDISPESVLAELPPSANKIDKIVHLLKKGFNHQEVSSVMEVTTREVALVEISRLQRSRRV